MSRPTALAVCTTAIGDTVLCMPALSSLGRVFKVDVLVHQKRLPLLMGNPYLNLLYPYRNNPFSRLGLRLRLRHKRYQRLLILHANQDILKLVGHLNFERAGCIQGWKRPDIGICCFPVEPDTHIADSRLALAAWAGAPPVEINPRIYLGGEEIDRARDWLAAKGLTGRPLVGMCPGAAQPFKAWPAERFGQLAGALAARGVQVLIFGAASEDRLVAAISAAAGHQVPAALGLDLRMTCSLLSQLDLLVSNDTGPLHLGAAVGTRVLGLFGPTEPGRIAPRQPHHRWLKVPPTCDPCITKACPESQCMPQMQTETVLAAALQMLDLEDGR